MWVRSPGEAPSKPRALVQIAAGRTRVRTVAGRNHVANTDSVASLAATATQGLQNAIRAIARAPGVQARAITAAYRCLQRRGNLRRNTGRLPSSR